MKLGRIGMRTVKTALAVFLTLVVSDLLQIGNPFFVVIAAILSMEPSVSESLTAGRDRILGTVVGGFVALVFSYFDIPGSSSIFIAIGVVLVIYISNLLGISGTIKISTIVFVSILINYEEGSRIAFTIYRIGDTLLGLVIGTLVNYFIVPPHSKKTHLEALLSMYERIKSFLKIVVWHEEGMDLDALRKELYRIEEKHQIVRKELKLHADGEEDMVRFKQAFDLFESTYSHLSILTEVEEEVALSSRNRIALEKLYQQVLIEDKNEQEIEDITAIVYNYHLNKILSNLQEIDLLVN